VLKRYFFVIPATLLLMATAFRAVTQTRKSSLEVYVVDVEGGNATLLVSPSGESVLIDTGNLNAAARDAGRIMQAVNDAGLTQIDHLITTHWHLDHFGGMAELARQIPIREFIDHGPNTQPNKKADAFLEQTYPSLYRNAKHYVVKAGETIPITGLDLRVVASAGETIKHSLPQAGKPNPYCANFNTVAPDRTENAQSIGSLITFGRFRFLHLADLSSDKEFDLMCPENRIGTVDLFMVSHHGQGNSNTEVLVDAIESRVAIMNNGIRKGGEPEVMKILHSASGLEDLWQLHFSELSGQKYNTPGLFIANHPDKPQLTVAIAPMPASKEPAAAPTHNGKAYWIKVSAQLDGSFTVTNSRTGFSKMYRARN
jgi:beta-lactamase superfamily II metal-dependent hydrolase